MVKKSVVVPTLSPVEGNSAVLDVFRVVGDWTAVYGWCASSVLLIICFKNAFINDSPLMAILEAKSQCH